MNRFAVMGSPISHSLSPRIHQIFASQLGISLTYEAIEVPLGHLNEGVAQFRRQGGAGANITVPLKEEAYALCAHHTERAKEARAVNTLYWKDEQLCGDNTDGAGLVRDLTFNLGLDLAGKRILILGAGGAVRGILSPLLAENPQSIFVVNRTLEKAKTLADRFSIQATDYQTLNEGKESPFFLIINATSSSLQAQLPPLSPRWIKNAVVIDLAYRQHQPTIFMQWAESEGALSVHDGIGMLVEQAALSFQRWHNMSPATQQVIEMLRKTS